MSALQRLGSDLDSLSRLIHAKSGSLRALAVRLRAASNELATMTVGADGAVGRECRAMVGALQGSAHRCAEAATALDRAAEAGALYVSRNISGGGGYGSSVAGAGAPEGAEAAADGTAEAHSSGHGGAVADPALGLDTIGDYYTPATGIRTSPEEIAALAAVQGAISNCGLPAACNALRRHSPHQAAAVVSSVPAGMAVSLHQRDSQGVLVRRDVVVGCDLPSSGATSSYRTPSGDFESPEVSWMGYVEKAFAVNSGSEYANLVGISAETVLESLTGSEFTTAASLTPSDMVDALRRGPVVVGTRTEQEIEWEFRPGGSRRPVVDGPTSKVVPSHWYSVYGVTSKTDSAGNEVFGIIVENPWGPSSSPQDLDKPQYLELDRMTFRRLFDAVVYRA